MADRSRADAYIRIDRGPQDPYRKTHVYTDADIQAGTLRFGVWRAPTFNVQDAVRHTVTAGDVGMLDLIAYEYYESEALWWVIAWANRIRNPITDMYVGQQLLIPPLEEVATALEKVI